MKHFLPSSVMLTPFVVKYYDSELDDQEDEEQENDSVCPSDEAPSDMNNPT
ncbi:hypothetical protein L4C39_01805 [Vibrio clamense]|uniref:hypothetical protein n=1 Tax=Vibrio TaxID=662 RepID=UPI0021C469AB|nr:hypothetical protein [Vibrio cortegadensis]MDN3695948.1 hypothetical protein [Vibrio cortegadensis]